MICLTEMEELLDFSFEYRTKYRTIEDVDVEWHGISDVTKKNNDRINQIFSGNSNRTFRKI